jgi:hypothetical protein
MPLSSFGLVSLASIRLPCMNIRNVIRGVAPFRRTSRVIYRSIQAHLRVSGEALTDIWRIATAWRMPTSGQRICTLPICVKQRVNPQMGHGCIATKNKVVCFHDSEEKGLVKRSGSFSSFSFSTFF